MTPPRDVSPGLSSPSAHPHQRLQAEAAATGQQQLPKQAGV